jgi:hypothetical protein
MRAMNGINREDKGTDTHKIYLIKGGQRIKKTQHGLQS